MKFRRIAVIPLIGALFVGAGVAGNKQDTAPSFALRDLSGRKTSSSDLHASIVVLDFWATWCEPCIAEIPELNRLYNKYGPRGVKVIGLAVQSGWARDIKKFVAKHKMQYTIYVGNDEVVSDFDVMTFPTTYVIAPGWKIRKKYLGAYNDKVAEIERDIEALLSSRDTK